MLDYYLGLIAKYSDDEREHVKKAASWALREIGKRASSIALPTAAPHDILLSIVQAPAHLTSESFWQGF